MATVGRDLQAHPGEFSIQNSPDDRTVKGQQLAINVHQKRFQLLAILARRKYHLLICGFSKGRSLKQALKANLSSLLLSRLVEYHKARMIG